MESASAGESVCRGCLRTNTVLTEKAFDGPRNKWMPHLDKLRYCFIDLNLENCEVFLLCKSCVNNLQISYNFKRTIQASEVTFSCYKIASALEDDDPFLSPEDELADIAKSVTRTELLKATPGRVVIKREPCEDTEIDVVFEPEAAATSRVDNTVSLCDFCKRSFIDDEALLLHDCPSYDRHLIDIARKTDESDVAGANQRCKHCDKLFSNDIDLSLHIQFEHYYSQSVRRKALGKTKRKRIPCQFCNKRIIDGVQMVNHLRHRHPEQADAIAPIPLKKIYKCRHCTTLFHEVDDLKQHESTVHGGDQMGASGNSSSLNGSIPAINDLEISIVPQQMARPINDLGPSPAPKQPNVLGSALTVGTERLLPQLATLQSSATSSQSLQMQRTSTPKLPNSTVSVGPSISSMQTQFSATQQRFSPIPPNANFLLPQNLVSNQQTFTTISGPVSGQPFTGQQQFLYVHNPPGTQNSTTSSQSPQLFSIVHSSGTQPQSYPNFGSLIPLPQSKQQSLLRVQPASSGGTGKKPCYTPRSQQDPVIVGMISPQKNGPQYAIVRTIAPKRRTIPPVFVEPPAQPPPVLTVSSLGEISEADKPAAPAQQGENSLESVLKYFMIPKATDVVLDSNTTNPRGDMYFPYNKQLLVEPERTVAERRVEAAASALNEQLLREEAKMKRNKRWAAYAAGEEGPLQAEGETPPAPASDLSVILNLDSVSTPKVLEKMQDRVPEEAYRLIDSPIKAASKNVEEDGPPKDNPERVEEGTVESESKETDLKNEQKASIVQKKLSRKRKPNSDYKKRRRRRRVLALKPPTRIAPAKRNVSKRKYVKRRPNLDNERIHSLRNRLKSTDKSEVRLTGTATDDEVPIPSAVETSELKDVKQKVPGTMTNPEKNYLIGEMFTSFEKRTSSTEPSKTIDETTNTSEIESVATTEEEASIPLAVETSTLKDAEQNVSETLTNPEKNYLIGEMFTSFGNRTSSTEPSETIDKQSITSEMHSVRSGMTITSEMNRVSSGMASSLRKIRRIKTAVTDANQEELNVSKSDTIDVNSKQTEAPQSDSDPEQENLGTERISSLRNRTNAADHVTDRNDSELLELKDSEITDAEARIAKEPTEEKLQDIHQKDIDSNMDAKSLEDEIRTPEKEPIQENREDSEHTLDLKCDAISVTAVHDPVQEKEESAEVAGENSDQASVDLNCETKPSEVEVSSMEKDVSMTYEKINSLRKRPTIAECDEGDDLKDLENKVNDLELSELEPDVPLEKEPVTGGRISSLRKRVRPIDDPANKKLSPAKSKLKDKKSVLSKESSKVEVVTENEETTASDIESKEQNESEKKSVSSTQPAEATVKSEKESTEEQNDSETHIVSPMQPAETTVKGGNENSPGDEIVSSLKKKLRSTAAQLDENDSIEKKIDPENGTVLLKESPEMVDVAKASESPASGRLSTLRKRLKIIEPEAKVKDSTEGLDTCENIHILPKNSTTEVNVVTKSEESSMNERLVAADSKITQVKKKRRGYNREEGLLHNTIEVNANVEEPLEIEALKLGETEINEKTPTKKMRKTFNKQNGPLSSEIKSKMAEVRVVIGRTNFDKKIAKAIETESTGKESDISKLEVSFGNEESTANEASTPSEKINSLRKRVQPTSSADKPDKQESVTTAANEVSKHKTTSRKIPDPDISLSGSTEILSTPEKQVNSALKETEKVRKKLLNKHKFKKQNSEAIYTSLNSEQKKSPVVNSKSLRNTRTPKTTPEKPNKPSTQAKTDILNIESSFDSEVLQSSTTDTTKTFSKPEVPKGKFEKSKKPVIEETTTELAKSLLNAESQQSSTKVINKSKNQSKGTPEKTKKSLDTSKSLKDKIIPKTKPEPVVSKKNEFSDSETDSEREELAVKIQTLRQRLKSVDYSEKRQYQKTITPENAKRSAKKIYVQSEDLTLTKETKEKTIIEQKIHEPTGDTEPSIESKTEIEVNNLQLGKFTLRKRPERAILQTPSLRKRMELKNYKEATTSFTDSSDAILSEDTSVENIPTSNAKGKQKKPTGDPEGSTESETEIEVNKLQLGRFPLRKRPEREILHTPSLRKREELKNYKDATTSFTDSSDAILSEEISVENISTSSAKEKRKTPEIFAGNSSEISKSPEQAMTELLRQKFKTILPMKTSPFTLSKMSVNDENEKQSKKNTPKDIEKPSSSLVSKTSERKRDKLSGKLKMKTPSFPVKQFQTSSKLTSPGKKSLLNRRQNYFSKTTKRIMCKKCKISFANRLRLIQHMKAAHGLKLSRKLMTQKKRHNCKCAFCVIRFKNIAVLKKHQLFRHPLECGKCKRCSETFDFPGALRAHEKTHATPYQCPSCPKAFARKENLSEHQRTHSTSNHLTCKICYTKYKSESVMERHMREHEVAGKGFFDECRKCRKVFKSWKLQEHEKRCKESADLRTKNDVTGSAACSVCAKKFPSMAEMAAHVETHYVLKCKACNKAFRTFRLLHKHVASTHAKRKRPVRVSVAVKKPVWMTLKCKHCRETFRGVRNLNRHMRRKHGSKKRLKVVKCKHCSKEFKFAALLKAHALSHLTKRKFRCNNCECTLRYDFEIKRHVKSCSVGKSNRKRRLV